MNEHQLTDLIFNALEKQAHAGREPPYMCMVHERECSPEIVHKIRKNLISLGYTVTATKSESQYNFLALPSRSS